MRLSHLLAISLCGISSVACHVDEIEVPNEELFTRSFIKEFGIADSDQEEIGEKPQVQSWIIGCEDLGSSFDFDFNDAGFGVSHFSTDDKSQNYLKVKALAAGGTLPIQLLWTDPAGTTHNVGTDYDKTYLRWNNWFGVDNVSQIINCNHSNDGDAYEGATVTIPLDRFPDYTITADNFKDGPLSDGRLLAGRV